MKRNLKYFVSCCLLTAFICSTFTFGAVADRDNIEIFVNSVTVNAKSKIIELPEAIVYDTEDIGITAVASVQKDGKNYSVANGKFVADGVGDYEVTYKAINSRGETAEKTVTVTVEDSTAPIVSAYAEKINLTVNEEYSLPEIIVSDFCELDRTVYIVNGEEREVVTDKLYFDTVQNVVIEVVYTEKRENGLSTTVTFDAMVVNQGAIYGFNDFGETGATYWSCAQSAQNKDPEIYQVPKITQNEDLKYVHDADGKSFKVEIKGKEGMSNSNSWPRIDTADISLPNLLKYEYLVAWIYNDSPDYDVISVKGQLNMSNAYTTSVNCKKGEWTKLKMPLSGLKSEKGNSLVKNIQFWVSGFEKGSIIYYVDDMYLE